MHQSIHQQLIRGIQGLNPAQARELQGLLARLKDGPAGAGDADTADTPAALATDGMAAGDVTTDTVETTDTVAAETLTPSDTTAATPLEVDGDLPQPVCAQEDQLVTPTGVWGPPPLSSINFEQMQLIACLIREANEARNARRQRYGM